MHIALRPRAAEPLNRHSCDNYPDVAAEFPWQLTKLRGLTSNVRVARVHTDIGALPRFRNNFVAPRPIFSDDRVPASELPLFIPNRYLKTVTGETS